MTSGVAHYINNLLTIIIGAARLLRRTVGKDAQALQRIDMVTLAAERGARLIRQLLAFARRQPLEPEIVNFGHLMTEVLPMVRRAVGEKIVVECATSGGLWNTTIDATQFQTAVLNLAINGRDAMPDGGKLTIEVANAVLDDAYAAHHAEVEPAILVAYNGQNGLGATPVRKRSSRDPRDGTRALKRTETVLLVGDDEARRTTITLYVASGEPGWRDYGGKRCQAYRP
jgi:nitrogen-specific signal transduction histidine kinase